MQARTVSQEPMDAVDRPGAALHPFEAGWYAVSFPATEPSGSSWLPEELPEEEPPEEPPATPPEELPADPPEEPPEEPEELPEEPPEEEPPEEDPPLPASADFPASAVEPPVGPVQHSSSAGPGQ